MTFGEGNSIIFPVFMEQKEYHGIGSIRKFGEVLEVHKPKRVFLVTDKASYETCGAKRFLDDLLGSSHVTRWHDFELNPKYEDLERGIALFRESKSDMVVAVGGGSVIDMAKMVNALAFHDAKPLDYIQRKRAFEQKGKPFVAIPTTAGTGSEATHFAVVYHGKEKYSLAHQYLLPSYAIVDPQFTFKVPPRITASTGMDALSQAIESYWNIYSTDESKRYAREAITLIMGNLRDAVKNSAQNARIAMARAANLAGKAINITKTTAPHAISYPITSYFGVSHGHAVALTLPSIFVYNSALDENDVLDKRGAAYVRNVMAELAALLGARDALGAKMALDDLMKQIGLETTLSRIGVRGEEDVELIIKNGFNPERVNNNPRLLTEKGLREILTTIL